jgi:hypothetical protein
LPAVLPVDFVDTDRPAAPQLHVVAPHATALATDRNTVSHLVRNARATSVQLRRLAQVATNHW